MNTNRSAGWRSPLGRGNEIRDVRPGYVAVSHEEGTTRKTWAPTEEEAREALEEL